MKSNRNDAKSHYTVSSRTKKPTKTIEEIDVNVDIDEQAIEENNEESLDSYVYSDVQVFGEEEETDDSENNNEGSEDNN